MTCEMTCGGNVVLYPLSQSFMILLFDMPKRMKSEETGGKPVCRDHRAAGQAGEDACLPK
jgi:hypothetical protein